MRVRERLALLAIVVLACLFAYILVRSVLRRAETTYNYPAYSSLNNSAEGLKAYFDTLTRLGYRTSRNYRPLEKLTSARAEVFYAGPGLAAFRYTDAKQFEQFEALANHGARLVIIFDSDNVIDLHKPNPIANPKNSPPAPPTIDLLKKRWGIDLAYVPRPMNTRTREIMSTFHSLPVTWRFSSWTTDWSPSQSENGSPLFLERKFGDGSILLIGDAKPFTNRELLLHPNTALLAAAAGTNRVIFFDESHLGLEDTGTVAGLATAHHLHWMLLGFLVLAALYVWHSAVAFIPPAEIPSSTALSGKDAHSALSSLLAQSIPTKSVLRVVAEEWNRTVRGRHGFSREISQNELNRLAHLDPASTPAEYNRLAALASHNKRMALEKIPAFRTRESA